jgi:3-dehydroquinate dehydratase/shikimate dehydrogenase
MRICLSIAPSTVGDARNIFHRYAGKCDVFEVRIDHLRHPDLQSLLRNPRPPVIITNRHQREHGSFRGDVNDQFNILSHAIELGAEFIDVEMSWGAKLIHRLQARCKSTKIICSYHNYNETPINLIGQYRKMLKSGAPILKIVTYANDISDNERIFRFLDDARNNQTKLIAFCMGDRGQVSRILAPVYGSYLTYAARSTEDITAPGQISLDDLNNIYSIRSLNKRSKIFGLVGNPVHHSRGIYFHNDRFRKKKINAVYLNFLVDDLPSFFETYRDRLNGFSVTMPFKEKIVPLLDSIDDKIKDLHAVNTVIRSREKFTGYNTDLLSVEHAVRKRTTIRRKNVLILGTGGMAKAMAYAMIREGANVTIAGRSTRKAKIIAKELGCDSLNIANIESLSPEILMNGTSVGMSPDTDEILIPKHFLRKNMLVLDAVYSTMTTRLIREARNTGCRIITGRELFEYQAVLQSSMFIKSLR